MSTKRVLQIIVALGAAGTAFSGYLTASELTRPAVTTCTPIGEPGTVLGYPPCIYGLVMYLAITALAFAGLLGLSRRAR
jgi:uncharacterized membrane protein